MTTEVKVEYVNGNKAMRVMLGDELKAELKKAGDAVNVLVHSGQSVSVSEHGEFYGSQGSAFGDASQQGGGEASPQVDARGLPPGAGEPGSSVPDVRIPDSQTEPQPSSDDVPADRAAENDAARTENSPTTRHGGPRGSI